MLCTTRKDCSGVDCSSTYHFNGTVMGYVLKRQVDFCHGFKLYPAATTGSRTAMDLYIDVLEKNITFEDRYIAGGKYDHITIPGADYRVGEYLTVRPFLDILFERPGGKLTLKITVKINILTSLGFQLTPPSFDRKLIDISVPLSDVRSGPPSYIYHNSYCLIAPGRLTTPKPAKPTAPSVTPKSKTHGKHCKINDIKSCTEPEECAYVRAARDTICQCPMGRPLPSSGECGPPGVTTKYPTIPGVHTTHATNSSSQTGDGGNTVAIAVGVSVTVVIVLVGAGLAYFYIRRRRNNPYAGRELVMTGDDDDDEPVM